ncbi:MAG: Na/Pi cotransporter family protein [Alphaproteobacteria bacterium]|nr:Na/Pi cotransporter family protein [Alphaproteobacteria bacterium]
MALLRMGVTYGFGAALRRVLAASTSNRIKSFFSGMGITALLQSSTATVLIVSGFAAQGMVKSSAGLGMVLGADVGTTLVAQLFSLNLAFLIPVMMILGYVFFGFKGQGKFKNTGRILIGAALMLLALGWIREVTEPLKESELLLQILNVLERDPFFTVLIAALLTWLMHSSLATVLLVMSFVASGVLPLTVALYMVLGANLGGTIPPLLATLKDHPESLRIPLGNLFIRLFGVCLTFFFIPLYIPYLAMIDEDITRQVVHFHTAFNLVLALSFLPFTGLVSRFCEMLIPDKVEQDDAGKARYLNAKDFETPSVALAAATRETLRMADMVQQMLDDTITVLKTNDMVLLEKVREEDNILDRLYDQIKTYMAQLSQEFLDPKEARRYVQVLTFATNLEHAGDVIDKNLMPLALKKIKRQMSFSEAGMKEIEHIHQLVMESVQLAQSIFVSGDKEMAKKILDDKQIIRDAEINGMATHIERLSEGVPETIVTSSLHIDIIRDYRRVNSYICSVAYPLLEGKDGVRTQSFVSKK